MKPLIERLRDEAETAEKGTAFMDDGNLIADTLVEVALLREAADALEAIQELRS